MLHNDFEVVFSQLETLIQLRGFSAMLVTRGEWNYQGYIIPDIPEGNDIPMI